MGIFTEIASSHGKFKGYVKPLIQDLELVDEPEKYIGFLKWVREKFIEGAAKLFENPMENQIGTKIPLEGKLSNPHANIFYAIVETLRNAFIVALKPSIDYEININSVKS
ncbi:MAG: hypothetical protein JWO06_2615, partial [Bacteroidota bacterium]|nr:hypothetical protein [Bacteroidota bacterium]